MEHSLQQVALTELGQSIGTPPSARLIESIGQFGVMQPVLLARVVDDAGEIRLDVIDGNRRIAAARKADISHAPAIVLDGISPDEIAEWTLIANGFRNANYLSELWAMQRLEQSNFSAEAIHRVSGMAKSSVDVRNRLLNLDQELLEGLRHGEIQQADAITASKLSAEDQDRLSQLFRRRGKLSRTDIVKMFPELASKNAAGAGMDDEDMKQPTRATLQNLLLEAVSIAGTLELDRDAFLSIAARVWDVNNQHL